jgi:hypothetical protein
MLDYPDRTGMNILTRRLVNLSALAATLGVALSLAVVFA